MELRGTWTSGQYADTSGFRTPLDVAIDPTNDRTYYVAGYEDHCIWKVVASADWSTSTVSVFAGDPGHNKGFADGAGLPARFNGPSSIVFDPIAIACTSRTRIMTPFVASARRRRHYVRRTAGAVTTDDESRAFGFSMSGPIRRRTATRTFTVTAAEAHAGKRPDVYLPQTVRVDSRGQVFVLDIGFGSIRRIDPETVETVRSRTVTQRY